MLQGSKQGSDSAWFGPSYIWFSSVILSSMFFFYCCRLHRDLHSFPTRRSSDLPFLKNSSVLRSRTGDQFATSAEQDGIDRKSTRLNSSHPSISYAVFCLKKKKNSFKVKSMAGKRPGPRRLLFGCVLAYYPLCSV